MKYFFDFWGATRKGRGLGQGCGRCGKVKVARAGEKEVCQGGARYKRGTGKEPAERRARSAICEQAKVLLVTIEVPGAPEAHSGGFPLPGPSPFIDGGAPHPIQMNGLALAAVVWYREKEDTTE